MTDPMIEFARARLDEDERIAWSAGGRAEQAWAADLSGKDPLGNASWPAVVRYTTDGRLRGAVANLPVMEKRSEDRMTHIARHDPARVLRGIAAKRRVVDEAAYWHDRALDSATEQYPMPDLAGRFEVAYTMLRALLTEWDDHPLYLAEWQPGVAE